MPVLEEKFSSENIFIEDNIKNQDFKTIITKIKKFGADAIILMTYEDTSLNFHKQIIELGLDIEFFCDKQDCATEKILKEVGNQIKGNYFEARVKESFKLKYEEKYGAVAIDDIQPAASVQALGGRAVQRVVNECRLAGSGHTRYAGHDAERDADVDILEVVAARPSDREPQLLIGRTALGRHLDPAPSRQVLARQ